METKIYVLTFKGIPQYATTNINVIKKECNEWFDKHCEDWPVAENFRYWLEDRHWSPNNMNVAEHAFRLYASEQFDAGAWDEYTWYECEMK